LGSVARTFVSHSATPLGFFRSRSAYSTTILSFERHSLSPIVGLSSGCRRRSSTAREANQQLHAEIEALHVASTPRWRPPDP